MRIPKSMSSIGLWLLTFAAPLPSCTVHHKLYSGRELPPEETTSLLVPGRFVAARIDGRAVEDNRFFDITYAFSMLPGNHSLEFATRRANLLIGERYGVDVQTRTISFTGDRGKTYKLVAERIWPPAGNSTWDATEFGVRYVGGDLASPDLIAVFTPELIGVVWNSQTRIQSGLVPGSMQIVVHRSHKFGIHHLERFKIEEQK